MNGYNENWEDPKTGAKYPNAWCVVGTLTWNYNTDGAIAVLAPINRWADQGSYIKGLEPLANSNEMYAATGDAYEKFFGDAVFEAGKTTPQQQAYLFVQSDDTPQAVAKAAALASP